MRKFILILFLFFLIGLLNAQSLTEISVTFQVNMELEIAAARFNPSTDTLFTRTSLDSWSDIVILSPSVTDTNIYVGSGNFKTFDGELFYYNSEYISDNKTYIEYGYFFRYTITDTDITNGFVILPTHGFNDTIGITMITLNEAEIKFIVDMNNAIDLNGTPFSSIDNVVIAGLNPPLELPTWGWPDSDSNKVIFMFDDGTNGDEIAYDNFWTKIITFPIYTVSPLRYQYGANWGLESNGGENLNETDYGVYHSIFFKSNFWYGETEDKFGIIEHKNIVNGIEQIGNEIPSIYELKQNYPNPFNPTTIINFSIPESGLVTLKVFNILGEVVAVLVNEVKSAGNYEVSFDAIEMTSGIYIYRIKTRDYIASKKMLLLK